MDQGVPDRTMRSPVDFTAHLRSDLSIVAAVKKGVKRREKCRQMCVDDRWLIK